MGGNPHEALNKMLKLISVLLIGLAIANFLHYSITLYNGVVYIKIFLYLSIIILLLATLVVDDVIHKLSGVEPLYIKGVGIISFTLSYLSFSLSAIASKNYLEASFLMGFLALVWLSLFAVMIYIFYKKYATSQPNKKRV